MDLERVAHTWLENATDPEIHDQLEHLLADGNESELEDAFFQELSFGTAGLRGVIGAGTNRMNIYTVGRATQGLANYILGTTTEERPRVAIARDSRNKGEEFVKLTASILAANGIEAHVFPRVEPTPALSFAVRDLHCDAGICMTASHNPAEYNGYKVYGSDGCQITSEAARAISNAIAEIDPFTQVKTMDFDSALEGGMVKWIEDATLERYLDAVISCSVEDAPLPNNSLSVVYTPLCGTGLECMTHMFSAIDINQVTLVPSQAQPDGNFPTCTYPNPETREALEEGIALCKEVGADILLATDPDADRVGVAIRHNNEYVLPTGNEMGILLLDYLCSTLQSSSSMPENPIAVSTIVSTAMIDSIAKKYGVQVMRTLTGFKYIGDIVTSLEQAGEQDRFILGFEESYGYLSGTHVRDKDAINAGMLICQMAQRFKERDLTLVDALENLYREHGYYANRTVNISLPGAEGSAKIAKVMDTMRTNPPQSFAGLAVQDVIDYTQGLENLPPANVVEFHLDNEAKVIFRPSGTEPKIKVYLFAKAASKDEAYTILDKLEKAALACV